MIVWPNVAPALVTLLPTVSGWSQVAVYDGPPVTQDAPRVYCTVGFVDQEASAGDFNQESGSVTGLLEETGAVRCELVVVDDTIGYAMQTATSLLSALDASLRADPSLGGVLGACPSVTLAADFLPVQNASGASVRVAMSVQYATLTAADLEPYVPTPTPDPPVVAGIYTSTYGSTY